VYYDDEGDWVTIDTDIELADICLRLDTIELHVIPLEYPPTVRVMTYNISDWNAEVSFKKRMKNLATVISDTSSDIICLQNV
jgi:hypothetical protein